MIDVTPSLSKSFVFEMVVTRRPYASDGAMRTDEVTRMDTLKSGWTNYVYLHNKVCLEHGILQIRLSSSLKTHDRSHKIGQKTEENRCVV